VQTYVGSGADISPDSEDRIKEFLARHGGAGSAPRREECMPPGDRGWYEIYAADGCALRCEWSRIGSREELKFSEVPPGPHADGRR
jgi:hypothetical protein